MPVLVEEALGAALAVTFLWSGSAKLGSAQRLSNALAGILRVPVPLAIAAARLFSLAEVTAALLLVFSATSIAPIFALILGAAIFCLSAYAAATHRVYSCGCFGSKSAKPIGFANAAYGALIVAAAASLWVAEGGQSSVGAQDALLRACAVSSVVLLGVMLGNASALRRPIANFTFGRA